MIRSYYKSVTVDSIPEIASREFGVGEFGKKISSRHLEFKTNSALNQYLRTNAPFYISYSNARYKFPSARPMEKKDLFGADLIYEFDADDIKTDCKETHDSWKCSDCGKQGKGSPDACDSCGSQRLSVEEWVCPECLGETKKQSLELIKIIENDLGFTEGISVNFSGSKGYHIHVRSSAVQSLSKSARLEILDYITGTNLDLESLGFYADKKGFFCPKISSSKGWSKKIFLEIERIFNANDPVLVASMGSTTVSNAKKLLKEKHNIITNAERGFLLSNGVNADKFWNSFLSFIVESMKLDVDRQTSVDINKIIRVPNTIHGSTGLLAKSFALDNLNDFNPLKETVVLGDDEIKIANARAPKFYLNGEWFGPFENESVSLPAYAAFYLLARKNAEVSN